MAWQPVRVWRLFLERNGFLLSSGMSYQALFATFAALYIAISLAGQWFVGDVARIEDLIDLINTYVPGLIGESGAITQEQVLAVAQSSFTEFGWGGVIAVGALIWTAIGWITYSRLAIRSMFGLPKDDRSYLLLKGGDLLAALGFGAALLLGAALTTASTNALALLLKLVGVPGSVLLNVTATLIGLLLVFAIDALVLVAMFHFLAGAMLRRRFVAEGALLGGLALVALQVLGSSIVTGVRGNPLLASFVVFVALLLWFRLTSIITMVAAAWVAERAESSGAPIQARPKRTARRRSAGAG